MKEPKFKPGDLVWACIMKGGEVAAVVESITGICQNDHYVYIVQDSVTKGECCEPWLRPRRDDYQQREPLSSRKELNRFLESADEAEIEHVVLK